MTNPEKHVFLKEDNKERIHTSVRVFAVAGIMVGVLEERLKDGVPPDEIPLVEVILAQKSDTNKVTAIGGEITSRNDLLHTAMDMVFRKSLLTRESRTLFEDHVGREQPIPYRVTGWEDVFRTFWARINGERYHREALLTVMPVRSSAISLHEPREDDEPRNVYKISHLVHFSPKEFQTLINNGTLSTKHGETYQIFGHLTRSAAGDVRITEEGRRVQNREFDRVLSEITRYEQTIRSEMITHINRERRYYNKPSVTRLGECTHAEISRAFLSAKMILGMQDEKIRDTVGKDNPPKTIDFPTAALYLREFYPDDLPNAFSTALPREVLRAAGILKYALKETVSTLYRDMGKDITPFRVDQNNNPKPLDVVGALRDMWPEVLRVLSGSRRVELIKYLNDVFTDALAVKLGKSRDIVTRAMEEPDRLSDYIASEIQKTKNTFQEHHHSNEAASASERPFTQMLHVLGLHPYTNIPYEEVTQNQTFIHARGEIFMQLAVFFATLPAIESRESADDGLFENGLASFLEFPQDDEISLLGIPHRISSRKTKGSKLELWYDKRRLKTLERRVMKSFQTAHIYDDFSHNFVILDENYSDKELRNIPMRLDRVNGLREELMAHFQQIYAQDGWDVSIVPGTYKVAVLEKVRDLNNIKSKSFRKRLLGESKSGGRPGSLGNSIVREKFVLSFKRGNTRRFTEVCIYPFQTIEVDGTPLKNSDLIGFIEKLEDDASGRYAGYRLIQVDPNDPTAPSALQLLRPEAWYRSMFNTIKLFQHTPKKKRTFRH